MDILFGKKFYFYLLLALLVAGAAFAQEVTSTVRGTVLDPTGAAIPGASIELTSPRLPQPLKTTTDATGQFVLMAVPPGTGYVMAATATGFRTARLNAVAVELGKATTLEVRMEVGTLAETIEVNASAVMVDTQSSSALTTVDKSFFEMIPKGRSFYDMIAIAPGARNEGKQGGFQIDGSSGSENTYFLDGMEVTNIQGGNLESQNRIPIEMVQQLEVKNGVQEAQYGGAMGGVVNAVVRSGTNDFHGEAGFYFNNSRMAGRPRPSLWIDPNDPDGMRSEYRVYCGYGQNCQFRADKYRTWEPVFSLGGPILKNRLFFFAGYAPVTTSTDRIVNFSKYAEGPDNQKYNSTFTQQNATGKLDFAPFAKLRMNASWVWNPGKTKRYLPGSEGTGQWDASYANWGDYTANNVFAGSVDYLATSKLVFSFRAGRMYKNFNNNYGIENTTATYTTSTKGLNLPGLPADFVNHGEGWVTLYNAFTGHDTYERVNYNADVTYLANFFGQHNLKGGYQRNNLSNDVESWTYPNGYYRYYWNRTYKCQTSACTTLKGPYGYYRFRILGTAGKASSDNQAIFFQDNWKVNRRLTLNLGIRTENEFVPMFSLTGKSPYEPIKFGWGDKLAPRLGFALDPMGDGKQKISASYGVINDIMKYELPRGSFGGDIWQEWYLTLDDPSWAGTNAGIPKDPAKDLKGTFGEHLNWRVPSNDPAKKLLDPNLKPVATQLFDLGYDRSISSTLVASFRYTHRRIIRTIEDTGYNPGQETYIIGNPGEGLLADRADWTRRWMECCDLTAAQAGMIPINPKPTRNYDALEARLDKRFSSKYQFSASYTLSRLWGNYGGLASSDESLNGGSGRNSPSVNRYYDMPWMYVLQNGKPAYGALPTDRTHAFKFFGTYFLNSKLGTTTFSPNMLWASGTPISTNVDLVTSTPTYPFGRGDMGRSPMFFNTDFNVVHEFAPFKNHESMKTKFEFTVFNLLNTSIVTDKYSTMFNTGAYGQLQFQDADGNATYYSIFSQGFDVKSLAAAQGIPKDLRYGLPVSWQSPRSARLSLKFVF